MKTILVATDFSEASDQASKYGTELAKAFGARIILYNAYQVLVPFPDGAVVMDPGAIREEVIKLLEVQSIGIARSGASVETYCTEAPAARGILKAAKEKKADIIIAGMKGRGKNFRKLLGSTVTFLARISDLPLIVVPEETEYRKPDIIGLAYDSDVPSGTNVHFLDRICELATTFEASLYFVKVVKEKSTEEFKSLPLPFRLSKAIRSADTKYEFLEGKDIAGVLNEFVRHRKIDILAVLPHRHSFFGRLFIHSNTRDTIFHMSVPLLILSGSKKTYTTRRKNSRLSTKTEN
jgi:nucleotide-binding universal stress UspA family protein